MQKIVMPVKQQKNTHLTIDKENSPFFQTLQIG